MRVPQDPQKAKPAWTGLPHVGQGNVPAAAPGGMATGSRAGVPVGDVGMRGLPPEASGFGGSWNDGGAVNTGGILGESPQGMPPLGLAAKRDGSARSSPAAITGAGGNTVRAVSIEEGAAAPPIWLLTDPMEPVAEGPGVPGFAAA